MKKILIAHIMALAIVLSACSATDGIYNTGKKVYNVGETVVEVSGIESNKLSNIDKVAESYDNARASVRELQDGKK